MTVTGAPRGFPASIWHDSTVPGSPAINDANPIEVGLKFRTVEEGFATGVRFYKGAGQHRHPRRPPLERVRRAAGRGHVRRRDGRRAGSRRCSRPPCPWPRTRPTWCPTTPPNGPLRRRRRRAGGAVRRLAAAGARRRRGRAQRPLPLRRPAASPTRRTPPRTTGSTSCSTSTTTGHPPSSTAPRLPASTAWRSTPSPASKFSEAMTAGSIALELRDAGGAAVAGPTTYAADKRRATFTPEAPLDPVTTYTVRVASARDRSGTSIAAPVEWTFTTTGDADQYPLTVWDTSTTPATPSVDRHACRRARRQVPRRRRRLRQGRALPPGPGQRRRPRGPPVDARRPAHRHGHLHRRERDGLAAGRLPRRRCRSSPGQTYVASYFAPAGGYSATATTSAPPASTAGVLHVPRGQASAATACSATAARAFPSSSYNDTDYGVDVVVRRPARHDRSGRRRPLARPPGW